MRSRISTVALAVAAALPSLASAVDFSWSGFSTAAYAQTDTDEAQVGYVGQPEGIDSDGSFTADSKLGVQFTARFNEMFSATVQGVAYADLTSDWEPHLDWAYVRFQPTSSLSARAGYMRAPTFMFSDSVFIGYANTWVRPPLEVYNLSPVYQLEGVDVTWRDNFGPLTVSVQPYYGKSDLEYGDPAEDLKARNWMGLAVTGEYNSLTLRAGYSEMELDSTTAGVQPLIAGLNSVPTMFCASCASEAEKLDLKGAVFKILDVGAQYDNGSHVAIVEYASRRGDYYLVPEMHSMYGTYGHRFGNFMPYVTYAVARKDGTDETSIPAVGALAPLAAGVTAAMSAANDDQDTWSLGLRYEVPSFSVLKGALLKFQYDHIDAKDGNGMFNQVQPGFDGKADMFSASFDFIF